MQLHNNFWVNQKVGFSDFITDGRVPYTDIVDKIYNACQTAKDESAKAQTNEKVDFAKRNFEQISTVIVKLQPQGAGFSGIIYKLQLKQQKGDFMQKVKVFIIVLGIIVIAATSFNSSAQAAQVTRINKNKGLIVIDGNKNDGFILGARVCFYSSSGEEITCGRVQQASESYATVKVNNRDAKQIMQGMEARILVEKKDGE